MLPYFSKEQLKKIDFNLQGKTVIITGGTGGIGNMTAHYLVSQGCNVVIAGRRENAEKIAREIVSEENPQYGNTCIAVSGDICSPDFRKEIISAALSSFGKIDALVNCAGINILDNAEDVKEEDWDSVISVDLKASFFMAQEVGKYMISENKSGAIVNITSQAGIVALNKHAAYCAAKAGVAAFTEVLALEWGKYGIRVNAVAPTVVLTDLGHKAWDGPVGEAFKETMPSKRFAEPEEISTVIAFLISDASAMITGHNLTVDGGYTIQ